MLLVVLLVLAAKIVDFPNCAALQHEIDPGAMIQHV